MTLHSLCRDCFTWYAEPGRCPACHTPRVVAHCELEQLSIAHIDCDAFYASIEKRDDPSLKDKPVIIGGGRRGVVSTACYVARLTGVRSAMPMFKALKLCPDAVVIKPRMARYVEASRAIRKIFESLTPSVEPLSLDEAFLDLTGTERLHGHPAAETLARVQAEIETRIGVTVSVGLSHNKFLAKIASDLDKPRGFATIGRAETLDFLADKPVSLIWGVGAAARGALDRDGIHTIGDLRKRDPADLIRKFGTMGQRLWHLAHGEDNRSISPDRATKSISNETTFAEDIEDEAELRRILWRLCDKVSARAKAKGICGRVVVLKLKRADHRILSRRHTLESATQMADTLFRTGQDMLHRDMQQAPFRLIGIGLSGLLDADQADDIGDLLDPAQAKRYAAERASDRIRERFGTDAIRLGRIDKI